MKGLGCFSWTFAREHKGTVVRVRSRDGAKVRPAQARVENGKVRDQWEAMQPSWATEDKGLD